VSRTEVAETIIDVIIVIFLRWFDQSGVWATGTKLRLGTRKRNICKAKLMSLKLIIKPKISEICTEAELNLRKDTDLKDENCNLVADLRSVLNRWKN
jgi:hypothetical protein